MSVLFVSDGAESNTGTDREYGSLFWYPPGRNWTSYGVSLQFILFTLDDPFPTVGIIFRVQTDNVYYSWDWSWKVGIRRLRKHTSLSNIPGSGSFTVLYADTIPTTMPDFLNATLNVVGNIYQLVWNGVIQSTYTDTSSDALTYGSIGIMTNNANSVAFDNLRVINDVRCQPGEWLDPVPIVYSNGTIVSQCHTCVSGWISTMANSPSCTMCTAGYYANGLTSCTACSAFSYSINGAVHCDLCANGYINYTNSATGVTGCVAAPSIIPMTLVRTVGVAGTGGGDTLDFDITHPVKNATVLPIDMMVTIYQTYQGVVNTWNCPLIVAASTETHISCIVPAVVIGVNLTYTVTIRSASVGVSVVSNKSVDQFSYLPTITAGTIRSTVSTPSTVYSSLTSIGEEIIFNGTNFGAWSPVQYWSVTYGATGTEVPCTIIAAKCTPYEVHCTTASTASLTNIGAVSGLVFRVTVYGQSVTGTDVYNYPDTPSITMISGCTDTPLDYTGSSYPLKGTYNCPTLGGTTITIYGEKLNSPMIFTINGQPCTAPAVVIEGSQWTCTLPAGAGYRQTVIASQNLLVGIPSTALWYAPATVTSIAGCNGTINQVRKVSECNRYGGDVITLTG